MTVSAANAKSLFMRLPGQVKGFLRNSLAGYILESKNLKDSLIYAKYWALIWAVILKFVIRLLFKRGPIGIIRVLVGYPWILHLLRVTGLMRRLSRGRSGLYLKSICMTIYTIAFTLAENLEDVFYHPDLLIINEEMVPPDIARAMGLKVWLLEAMGILLPILAAQSDLKYIDEAENAGINPDACSLPKATVGMVLKGHMPKGIAMVSSNMPCDAGMASYSLIHREHGTPIYRLDVPSNF